MNNYSSHNMNENQSLDMQQRYNGVSNNDSSDQRIIDILAKAVREEKFCPLLLPYKEDLVNQFIKCIHQQEENLQSQARDPDTAFINDIMQHEIERLKFMLKSYFRARNWKIEKYCFWIIQKDYNAILSKAEFKYCQSIYKLY